MKFLKISKIRKPIEIERSFSIKEFSTFLSNIHDKLKPYKYFDEAFQTKLNQNTVFLCPKSTDSRRPPAPA